MAEVGKYVIEYSLLFILVVLVSEGVTVARNRTNPRIRSFHCINGQYVFDTWFCDGANDCGDGSDEAYGCSDSCGVANFTCQDGTCKPISVRCNVAKDCPDGSDELYCDHEPDFKDCKIPNGKFLCKDKLRCIDLSYVCDEENHCLDRSDEGAKCDDYDHEICNVCHEGCYRTPDGPFCFYNVTAEHYEVGSKYIGNCDSSRNYCEQKCVRFNDVKQCSCEENFVPVYTMYQTFYCEEKDKSKNMLVYSTNKGEIRGIPGYANYSISIKKAGESVTAIAAANGNVYWGGVYMKDHVIGRSSFHGNDTKIVVSTGIGEINAMDVDWRTGNIYFIDNIKKRIVACTASGRRCIEVYSLSDNATSIALAPRHGYMFWSMRDDEYGFVIKKSEMNGQNYYPFLDDGLRDVSAISVDEAAEKLYFLDAVRRRIEVIRFDNSGRKVFKSDLRMNYLSLTVNARYLYWNLANDGTIFFTPQTRILLGYALNGTDPVLHIYGYSYSEKTTKMEAPCSWGCEEGICLIHALYFNRTGSNCICNNSEVESNGVWCRNTSEAFFNEDYDDGYNVYLAKPRPFGIILVVASFIVIVFGIAFYLYRKGFFSNVRLMRHSRMTNY